VNPTHGIQFLCVFAGGSKSNIKMNHPLKAQQIS